MRKKAQAAYRNRNHTGWWVFREVEQWVSKRQKKLTPKSRCLVWENTRLIRAESRDEAYRKALRVGRIGHPSKTKGGTWHFVGISLLLPLYEKIEDGVEILWTEHRNMPVERIKRLVRSKRQLPVFDDRKDA